MAPVVHDISRSRRRQSLTRTAAVSAVVAVTATGCSIDLSHLRPGGGEPEETPEEQIDAAPIVESALEDLANWPAIQVSGQMAKGSQDPWETEVTVSDSGAVHGTIQTEEAEVEILEVDERLFFSAGDDYWLTHGSSFSADAEAYPDNWVRVAGNYLGYDPRTVFTPAELAEILREQVPAAGEAEAVEDEHEGTPAYRVALSGGEIWVAAEEPHQVLRIQIAELASLEAEDDTMRTDVNLTQPDVPAIEEFYETVLTSTEDLKGARDSRFDIGWEGDIALECVDGGGCTVSGTITDLSSSTEGSTRVRMDATVSNDTLGTKECNDTQTLEAGGTADLSCTVDFSSELASYPNTQTFDMSGEAIPSTRALGGGAIDETVASIEEQRDATLELAESAAG